MIALDWETKQTLSLLFRVAFLFSCMRVLAILVAEIYGDE